MPSRAQLLVLVLLSVAFWVVAALCIRLLPAGLTDPALGSLGFVASLPVAWLSVRLTARCARLAPDQILAGLAVVGAVAMMMDGAALRWAPAVYGGDDGVARLGAAWLLWGYGASLGAALVMAARRDGAARDGCQNATRPVTSRSTA